MRLSEPMTMATDYLLALLAAGLGIGLLAEARVAGRRARGAWGGALLATAVAAAVGGSVHGFAWYIAPGTHAALWRVIDGLIAIASFLMLAGALLALVPQPPRRALLGAGLVKTAVFLAWLAVAGSFRGVVWDSVVTMTAVLGLLLWRRASAGAGPAILGILVAMAAAALQQARVGLHEQFNHNDLYHVVQGVSLWLLARGGRQISDAV